MNTNQIISYCRKNNISWAFFDYFDTTATRNCSAKEIKLLWAKNVCQKLNYTIDKNTLYNVRISSEKKQWNHIFWFSWRNIHQAKINLQRKFKQHNPECFFFLCTRIWSRMRCWNCNAGSCSGIRRTNAFVKKRRM